MAEARTTGTSQRIEDAQGNLLSLGVQRYATGTEESARALWRLWIGQWCNHADAKVEVTVTAEMLRKMGAWCTETAGVVERDGVIPRPPKAEAA